MATYEKYKVDIRFLRPLITAYKFGLFHGKDLPPRVMEALDSLSYYDYIEERETPDMLAERLANKPKVSWRDL